MLILIEGLCYTHPHHPELVASNSTMRGVWRKCVSLTKEKGAVMAPLFIDDRPQEGELCIQTVNDLLQTTTGKPYESFHWLGDPLSEAELQAKHGALGCVQLDVLYHLHVLWSLALVDPDWKWIVVHPLDFKEQQAGMLTELWKRISSVIDISIMADRSRIKKEDLQSQLRKSLLNRFSHYWVDENGEVVQHTYPVYADKQVWHKPCPVEVSV